MMRFRCRVLICIYAMLLLASCGGTEKQEVIKQQVEEDSLKTLSIGSYGIDISEYQGFVNFDTLETIIDFVFIRASAGTRMTIDNFLEHNYANASRTSLRIGYYHYFNYVNDPEAQADMFLDAVSDRRNDFPLVVDIEHSNAIFGQNLKSNSKFMILNNLYFFTERLKQANQRFMFYTNKRTYYDLEICEYYPDVPIWIADYACDVCCEIPNLCIRQYSCKGTIDGVCGVVDLNVMIEPEVLSEGEGECGE